MNKRDLPTEQQIDRLVGRDLDRAVHEFVFGDACQVWSLHDAMEPETAKIVEEGVPGTDWRPASEFEVYLPDAEGDMPNYEYAAVSTGTYRWLPIPHYSISRQIMWAVINQMSSAHNRWCQMRTPFGGSSGDGHWAGFTPHGTTGWNGRPDFFTKAAHMPLAVCRSALKAVISDMGFIQDGFGNVYDRWCDNCGEEMQIVRPGKVQCPDCAGE